MVGGWRYREELRSSRQRCPLPAIRCSLKEAVKEHWGRADKCVDMLVDGNDLRWNNRCKGDSGRQSNSASCLVPDPVRPSVA